MHTFKVGDKVNALIYPDKEIIGEITEIHQHNILVKNEEGTFLTSIYVCDKIEYQIAEEIRKG